MFLKGILVGFCFEVMTFLESEFKPLFVQISCFSFYYLVLYRKNLKWFLVLTSNTYSRKYPMAEIKIRTAVVEKTFIVLNMLKRSML